MKIKKLSSSGFSHHVILAAFVAVFAIAGVAYLVASHADSPQNVPPITPATVEEEPTAAAKQSLTMVDKHGSKTILTIRHYGGRRDLVEVFGCGYTHVFYLKGKQKIPFNCPPNSYVKIYYLPPHAKKWKHLEPFYIRKGQQITKTIVDPPCMRAGC